LTRPKKNRRKPAPPQQDPGALRKPGPDFWIGFGLVVAVLAVYFQVRSHDFVSFDDPIYVTENPLVRSGLTWSGLVWAFTTFHDSNWFPLTWLSHMLDCELFGLDSGWHHLTNVGLHALSTLVLFVALRRMTGARWRSGMVTLLFAVHPLHVESVAWVAERKDVLSALFWMLTLWAYTDYATRLGRARYALTLFLFCLGLMAKPMLVTLPVVLLLLDLWPLRRGVRILEKLPFFTASLASSSSLTSRTRRAGQLLRSKLFRSPLVSRTLSLPALSISFNGSGPPTWLSSIPTRSTRSSCRPSLQASRSVPSPYSWSSHFRGAHILPLDGSGISSLSRLSSDSFRLARNPTPTATPTSP
jgi:hypothetical protein